MKYCKKHLKIFVRVKYETIKKQTIILYKSICCSHIFNFTLNNFNYNSEIKKDYYATGKSRRRHLLFGF